MDTTSSVSTWTALIQQFFPVFTVPSAPLLLDLVTGWVLCTARRTITGILPFADPRHRHAHDAFHRFFPDTRWDMSQLWRLLATLLIKAFYPQGTIEMDLDDTLFHRCGHKVSGLPPGEMLSDPPGPRPYLPGAEPGGSDLASLPTLGMKTSGPSDPDAAPSQRGRLPDRLGPGHAPAGACLAARKNFGYPHGGWHADGFYATLAGCDRGPIHLISRLRRDAVLYEPLDSKPQHKRRGRPPTKGQRRPTPDAMAQKVRRWLWVPMTERGNKAPERLVYARVVLWYRVLKTPILLVISRDLNRLRC